MVFNDADIAKFVSQNFVSVSASDVDYNHLPADAKAKGEFRFLKQAFADAPHGIHQGVYVVTSSGKFIQQCSTGWPHIDTRKSHALLKAALRTYKSMPKTTRLASKPLSINERSMHRKDLVSPPESWVKIRTTTRSYPFQDMELFDQRHPAYYKLDRLWLTPETAKTLVPRQLIVGAKSEIRGRILDHLMRDNHMMLGCAPWNDESVKKVNLHAKVTAKKGSLYQIQYHGELHLDSSSRWNKSAYHGKLLGKAIWNDHKKQFQKLHWITLGKHNQRELRSNETRGNVHVTTVGSIFELDPLLPNDRGIIPHSWEDHYPRAMKERATR